MPRDTVLTLRGFLRECRGQGQLLGPAEAVCLAALAGPMIGDALAKLAGRNVLLNVTEQVTAARAMIALDGVAARLVVCPPGVSREDRDAIVAKAAIDTIVDDAFFAGIVIGRGDAPTPARENIETQWLLLTSGTTGAPKLVSHTLQALTGAMMGQPAQTPPVWATFYDIRRYGGLQIFLRAVVGGGSLVVPAQREPLPSVVARYGACGVTHISGTPSHWRRLLMMSADATFAPTYVRLSGEIADQAILDALHHRFPLAKIGHAYASTEAGVGFEVNDGRAGFPASYVENAGGAVEMRVVDNTLCIRSTRTAGDYVGETAALHDDDGFVDTGDLVERLGDRYFFKGRRGGIINVGGQKVHPEEIEAVINRHAAVRMSLVKSRRSPITGAIVAADVVLTDLGDTTEPARVRQEIDEACRAHLPAWKVPASIRFVPALDVTSAGKLARHA